MIRCAGNGGDEGAAVDIRASEIVSASPIGGKHSCSACPVGDYCLPRGLRPADAERLDQVMRIGRPLQPKQYLFHAGEPLKAIYAVRHGAFKSVLVDCDGNEQVVGFHVHSELFGLDAIFSGVHQCSAVALTAANVCVFPYKALIELSTDVVALAEQLLRLLSKDLITNIGIAGDYLADERLAAFLLSLAQRMPPRGELSRRYSLPMPRADIASYLRLAGETLSRALARFQQLGLIDLKNRTVTITDLDGLRQRARRIPPALL